ncbi:MAG: radical SAM protein [Candidatus Omnitrophica bacterium]|nr:radical SAM protein [Candidatus Omnitrophota bacterium]
MRVMFVYPGFENIGIEYLSAVLKSHGFDTKLAFDPRLFNDQFIKIKPLNRIFSYEEILLKKIRDFAPELIGFSVVNSDYPWALNLAKKIKSILSTHISFGGIHPSSVPEEVMKQSCVDSVVIGEGELAFLELANSLRGGKIDYAIKNIYFRKENQLIKNPLRPYIDNLDSLPFPDKELYYREIPRYRRGYTIITRRGCINSCSYCHNTVWQKLYPESRKIRLRSVGNVLKELAEAKKKYNFKLLRINDDLFTYDKEWLRDFSKQYRKEINIPLYCFGSPSTIDEEVISYLKDASCYQLCLGVQSVNEQVRREIFHRQEPNEKIIGAIRLCRKNNIRVVADNIVGYPGQTDKDFSEIADFYSNHRAHRICVFWLIYFPGTDIVDIARKKGVLTEEEVRKLAARPAQTANTLYYNKPSDRNIKKFCLFLELYHLLPPALFRWMLGTRFYKMLPAINPAVIAYFYTIFARDRLDIPRRRYYVRYLKYIPEVLLWKAKNKK